MHDPDTIICAPLYYIINGTGFSKWPPGKPHYPNLEVPIENYNSIAPHIDNLEPFSTYIFSVYPVNDAGLGEFNTCSGDTDQASKSHYFILF